MVIKLANAALLLFAGFMLGSYITSETKSLKISATTSSSAARAPASSPGPAVDHLVEVVNAQPSVRPPVDLAAYLLRFGIADVHEACSFARDRFNDQSVAPHARFVKGLENFKDHRSYISQLGKRLSEGEKFWVAQTDLRLPEGNVHLEMIMDSHAFLPDAEGEDNASCFRAHVRLNLPDGRHHAAALDACTDQLVTKDRNYYFNWEAFTETQVGRYLTVVQIPLPEAVNADLEFIATGDQAWSRAPGFRWEAVTLEQGLRRIDAHASPLAQNR